MQINHDPIAGIYDKFINVISLYQTVKTKEFILEKVDEDLQVLEVGCGNGGLAIACARRGARVIAVDVSNKMIANATKLAKNEGIKNIQFIESDFFSLTPKKRFDLVILCYFLNVFPDEKIIKKVLKKARLHLNPGGRLIIADELEPSDPILASLVKLFRIPVFYFFELTTGLKFHGIHNLEKIMKSSGFKVIEEKKISISVLLSSGW